MEIKYLILLVLLVGCVQQQPQYLQPQINTIVQNQTNITNQTIIETPKNIISIPTIHNGNLTVYFIDVGQGDGIFIVTPDKKTMLIDGGRKSQGPNVVSFIRNLGFNKIDYVVGTNPDADHIGALIYLIQKLNPDLVIDNGLEKNTETYKEYKSVIENGTHKIISFDSAFDFGENILSSFIVAYDDGYGFASDINDNSVLFRMNYKNVGFLFTGDCSEECESRLGDSDLDVDVLKVGHHGSCTSSTMYLLNKVTPKYSMIQSGADNQYGHPCKDVLERLKAVGSEIYRNDEQGTIILTTDGERVSVYTTK